jgi:photosystem II stability/assembly factor-like uncharacterized protein
MGAMFKPALFVTIVVSIACAGVAAENGTVPAKATRQANPSWQKGTGAAPVQNQPCVAIKLPAAAANGEFYGVSFIDPLNGWIVGQKGLCLRTTDGGQQWTVLKVGSEATLRAVQFHADGAGWACGDGDPKAPAPSAMNGHVVSGRPYTAATLLHTTDGGATWKSAWLPTNFEARSLASTPAMATVGTSGGDNHLDGDLLRVEKAGGKFTFGREGAFRAIFALASLGDDRLLAAGSPVSLFFFTFTRSPLRAEGKCRILLSADGGKTWELAKVAAGKGSLRGLAVHGAKTAVAVGDGGQIFRGDDAGKNWQPVARRGDEQLLAAACNEDGVFAAVGHKAAAVGRNRSVGAALVSKDGGKTWKPLEVDTPNDLRAISATGKMFYIVGGNGTVLRVAP